MAQKEYRQLKLHHHHYHHHRSSHYRPTLRVGSNVHGGGGEVSTPSSCHSVAGTPIGGGNDSSSSSRRNSSSALCRYPLESSSHSHWSGYPEDLENQWKSRYLSIYPSIYLFSPTTIMRECVSQCDNVRYFGPASHHITSTCLSVMVDYWMCRRPKAIVFSQHDHDLEVR